MARWRAVLPVALALVVALTASIIIYKWLQRQTAPKKIVKVEAEAEAVLVAVATVDLAWGTKLRPEMLRYVPYLKESLPSGYSSDLDSLKGRVLRTPLKQNEAILESKLAPTSVTTGGVSTIVKPGKRALAVRGDKVIGISGFILPGNRVDVLVTLTHPKTKKKITKIVLENITVLASGTEIQENDSGPAPVDVYTLEVTPTEGEKLALAATHGRLQFALRGVFDVETVLTRGATIRGTLSSFRPPVRKRKPVKTSSVETIKGDKVGKEKFR
ncbi:MAG: Flp pilus assembly protein CpaB [Desulfobacteraceae bacterium]|nr:Flp pilus assembly protein CpaB [Desulfobacteraceae bacterium]